jgi:hypothetical protein
MLNGVPDKGMWCGIGRVLRKNAVKKGAPHAGPQKTEKVSTPESDICVSLFGSGGIYEPLMDPV